MAAAKRKAPPTAPEKPRKAAPKPAGHKPTPALRGIVARSVEKALPDVEIAELLGLDVVELRRAYKAELALAQGRPAHEPTAVNRKQVETLSAFGIKHDAIAALLGISDETLRKHYRAELDLGGAKAIAQVANSLYLKALSDRPDAVNAAKFYLAARAGWAEKKDVDLKAAVELAKPNLSALTDDELAALEALAGRMVGDPGRLN